jgi:hypothetical protein
MIVTTSLSKVNLCNNTFTHFNSCKIEIMQDDTNDAEFTFNENIVDRSIDFSVTVIGSTNLTISNNKIKNCLYHYLPLLSANSGNVLLSNNRYYNITSSTVNAGLINFLNLSSAQVNNESFHSIKTYELLKVLNVTSFELTNTTFNDIRTYDICNPNAISQIG